MNRNDKEYLVQRIRTQYTEREGTQLDELKELDRRVKLPAKLFGYTLGTLSALVMGSGMSLVMTDIGSTLGLGNTMTLGIIIGVAGLFGAVINYPVYNAILNSRKEKYADRIITLSDRIMDKE